MNISEKELKKKRQIFFAVIIISFLLIYGFLFYFKINMTVNYICEKIPMVKIQIINIPSVNKTMVQIQNRQNEIIELESEIEELHQKSEAIVEIETLVQEQETVQNETVEEETYPVIEETYNNNLYFTNSEMECLYRAARSEAGDWSKEGQKNVVYVILNRLYSERFKEDNIIDIVFADNQFEVISNGLYYRVEIDDFTIANVDEAISDYIVGESAEGALFFTQTKFNRVYLFTDEVGHNFYK